MFCLILDLKTQKDLILHPYIKHFDLNFLLRVCYRKVDYIEIVRYIFKGGLTWRDLTYDLLKIRNKLKTAKIRLIKYIESVNFILLLHENLKFVYYVIIINNFCYFFKKKTIVL